MKFHLGALRDQRRRLWKMRQEMLLSKNPATNKHEIEVAERNARFHHDAVRWLEIAEMPVDTLEELYDKIIGPRIPAHYR